jgi:hypothetical protein
MQYAIGNWLIIVLDARVFRGPEIESHHYLLVNPVRMRPRWYTKKKKMTINIETSFKVSLFRDLSITWLNQRRLDNLTHTTPMGSNAEDE